MPTIQSKKYPDNVQFVTVETWKNFIRLGKDRNFTILDNDDIAETVVGTPEQIVDFSDNVDTSTEDNVEEILSREDIKTLLDEHEQEYNPRAATSTLLKQLNTYLESL